MPGNSVSAMFPRAAKTIKAASNLFMPFSLADAGKSHTGKITGDARILTFTDTKGTILAV
jgi:hypothetical protein